MPNPSEILPPQNTNGNGNGNGNGAGPKFASGALVPPSKFSSI